jgi:hypothetical protein
MAVSHTRCSCVFFGGRAAFPETPVRGRPAGSGGGSGAFCYPPPPHTHTHARNHKHACPPTVLVAEVVASFFPKLVELHNYSPANSMQQKLYNWNTLNTKVFRKLGFVLHKEDQAQ